MKLWFISLCVIIYRTLKPNGTKELFRQHKIGLDKAMAREQLRDSGDDKFLYEACQEVECSAEAMTDND